MQIIVKVFTKKKKKIVQGDFGVASLREVGWISGKRNFRFSSDSWENENLSVELLEVFACYVEYFYSFLFFLQGQWSPI